ncbi:MAG: hypothetical protein M3O70_27055 [Actinomycetota bacterium]|nr:hypothetical protein [Actinomycetota bacterium]
MTRILSHLRPLRYEEVFGAIDPPIRSSGAMLAPDRLRFEVRSTAKTTWS